MDIEHKSGVVYMLINPSYHGKYGPLPKIGHSTMDGFLDRKKSLYRTGVPGPFETEVLMILKDKNEAKKIETAIHNHLDDCRYNSRREFFDVPLDRAKEVFKFVKEIKSDNAELWTYDKYLSYYNNETEDDSEEEIEDETFNDNIDAENPKKKRSRINLLLDTELNIGDELICRLDPTKTCTVVGDREVEYNGIKMSITKAAEITNTGFGPTTKISGSVYWMYDGETIQERRIRLEQIDSEKIIDYDKE